MSQTELLIGQTAPALHLAEFIKGEPFDRFAAQTVYVVEFWATWCGPCKRAIEHLTALQRRHPEAVVLGVAVSWQSLQEVKDFVAGQGDDMDYRVAIDLPAPEGKRNPTRAAWCDAAYQVGIPSSFIVDQAGRVVWMGHPTELDAPLAAVLARDFDLAGHTMVHNRWLEAEKIRESWALKRELEQYRLAGNLKDMLSLYTDTLQQHPELINEHGLGRLKLMLELSPVEALVFSRALIDGPWAHQVNLLYSTAMLLISHAETPGGTWTQILNEVAARLACQALEQVEQLLGAFNGMGALKFHMLQARAHLVGGDATGALDHASKACEQARSMSLDEDHQTQTAALLQRCQQALDE